MSVTFVTLTQWNESVWKELTPIYREAFPHGAKPEGILRGMVERGIASLHAGYREGVAVAMAVTGLSGTGDNKKLIIDYLAVRTDCRGEGIGKRFIEFLRDSATAHYGIRFLLIEAEAENTPENNDRIRFWENLGFRSTSYIHRYRWVPEPYRTLLLPLEPGAIVPDDGESLFQEITQFHQLSFRRS